MGKLTLADTVDDLVDRIYSAIDITEEWTSRMHRRATDKVKREVKAELSSGVSLGEAFNQAIRTDAVNKDGELEDWRVDWLTGRLNETAEEMGVDLGTTEHDAKQAHHEMIDNERVFHGSNALVALADLEDIDPGQRCYAQVVVLYYMNARAVYDDTTNKRTKGAVDVAGEKTVQYAHTHVPDMSDDEQTALNQAVDLGKQLLNDAIAQSRQK